MVDVYMKRIHFGLILFVLVCILSSCGSKAPEETKDSPPEAPQAVEPVAEPAEEPAEPVEEPETYDDIAAAFCGICDGADLSATMSSSRIHVRIKTDWPFAEPENWGDIASNFGTALETTDPMAAAYDASTVSAEILAADGSVLASGYNGKVQYTAFEERDTEIREGTTLFDPESAVSENLDRIDEELDGVQSGLDETQPANTSEKTYILNTNTMKFHKPSCNSVEDIAAENRSSHTGTRDDVIAMGYVPCKRCHP